MSRPKVATKTKQKHVGAVTVSAPTCAWCGDAIKHGLTEHPECETNRALAQRKIHDGK